MVLRPLKILFTHQQGSRLTAFRCHRHEFAGWDALILLPATLLCLPAQDTITLSLKIVTQYIL